MGRGRRDIENTTEAGSIDIPVISFFFSSQGTERSRRRILILVRAKIVIPEEAEPLRVR